VRDDPLAEARLAGLRSKTFLLQAEGGAVPVEEAAAMLGLTRQAVDRWRRAGKLIGLTMGRRGYLYPAWQFGEHGTIPGLEETLAALDSFGPWSQVSWFNGAALDQIRQDIASGEGEFGLSTPEWRHELEQG